MRKHFQIFAASLLALGAMGCGGDTPEARQDILNTPREELYGASTKSLLYEFRAKVRKHGVEGAKDALPELQENFQGYEQLPLGEHMQTWQQIDEKLKELESALGQSPSREQVTSSVEEIGTLADKLPGKADENPQVE